MTYNPDDQPMSWMSTAACTEVVGDIFFLERGDSAMPAKSVCARCDVVAQCLEYAQRNFIDEGVFGGLSPLERQRMRWGKKVVA